MASIIVCTILDIRLRQQMAGPLLTVRIYYCMFNIIEVQNYINI